MLATAVSPWILHTPSASQAFEKFSDNSLSLGEYPSSFKPQVKGHFLQGSLPKALKHVPCGTLSNETVYCSLKALNKVINTHITYFLNSKKASDYSTQITGSQDKKKLLNI